MFSPVKITAFAATGVFLAGGLRTRGANGGALDMSFNRTGMTQLNIASNFLSASVALQSDGKIVIGALHDGQKLHLAVYRFLPDGTPDRAFAQDGRWWVAEHIPRLGGPSYTAAVFLLDDGRILVSSAQSSNETTAWTTARALANGLPDETFGPGGLRLFHLTRGGTGPLCIARQNDGKLLCSNNPHALVRLNPDTSLDQTFGTGGAITVNPGGHSGALGIGANGKILVGEDGTGFTLHRLHPGGSPDGGFGGSGRAVIPVSGHLSGNIRRLFPMEDGRILAAGTLTSSGTENVPCGLARFLPDGTADPAFAGTGFTAFSHGKFNDVNTLLLQPDGRILTIGTVTDHDQFQRDVTLVRSLPDGTPDPGFGAGGKVRTDAGAGETSHGAIMVPHNRLIVAANRWYPDGSIDLILLRYLLTAVPVMSVTDFTGNLLSGQSLAPVQDFGLIMLGSSSREFTIRNDGPAPLIGLSVSVTEESHPGEVRCSLVPDTLASGAQTTFAVTLFPPATASPGPRIAKINISGNDPAANPLLIPVAGIKATPSQIWRYTWFGSPDNSGTGADLNDFDRDGLQNLLEYATASNPHRSNLPIGAVAKNGDGALTYTWPRNKASLTELNFHVETASHPAGPWSITGIIDSILADDGTVQTVQSVVSNNSETSLTGKQFVRLRVTRL